LSLLRLLLGLRGTSEDRNVKKVLEGYSSVSKRYLSEDELRKEFEITENDVCVDGGCHETACSFILVEVEKGHCDTGLKQLEKFVELFESQGHKVRETVLVAKSLKRLSRECAVDQEGYLINRMTRSRIKVDEAEVRFTKRL
jgi:hypothetical protein